MLAKIILNVKKLQESRKLQSDLAISEIHYLSVWTIAKLHPSDRQEFGRLRDAAITRLREVRLSFDEQDATIARLEEKTK